MNPSTVLVGDVMDGLRQLPDGCVHCCVTSPPYWGLRDYGVDGQIGLEASPAEFVARMVAVFREVRRVLRHDGTCWLNIGDSYAGSGRGGYQGEASTLNGYTDSQDLSRQAKKKMTQSRRRDDTPVPRSDVSVEGLPAKNLCLIPWRLALALQDDGWWVRSIVAWAKKSPMPEPCRDRPTSAWEPIFLLTKSERYFYDADAVREPHTTANRAGERSSYPAGSSSSMAGDEHVSKRGAFVGLPLNPAGRNMRNVWHLAHEPYADAHFATFPTEIPRRAIKAGTSEKGCCPACGAGWRRMTEDTPEYAAFKAGELERRGGGMRSSDMESFGLSRGTGNKSVSATRRTLGWSPSCECSGRFEWREEPPDDPDDKPTRVRVYLGDANPPVPALVLDPFLGSGTTVAVARELGRHGVGCELNPEYAKLARERIGRAEKPLTFRSSKATDGGLFTEGHQ